MTPIRRRAPALLSLLLLAAFAPVPSRAVILYERPERNTSAPTGALAGSGWQYQGQFGAFLGTAIAPNYFVTARHVGAAGQSFVLNGVAYPVLQQINDSNSDLAVWRVDGTLPVFAPLFTGSDEIGRDLVVFGRGTQRGDPVTVGGALAGWGYGPGDGVPTWGQNRFSDLVVGPAGSAFPGDLLTFNFDRNGGANEAHLSGGDSGGGVFVNDNGVWKLAGINSAVDAGLFYDAQGTRPADGALFDARGLFVDPDGSAGPQGLTQITGPSDVPTAAYVTRISSNLSFIQQSTSAVPEPSTPALLALAPGVLLLLKLRRRRNINPLRRGRTDERRSHQA